MCSWTDSVIWQCWTFQKSIFKGVFSRKELVIRHLIKIFIQLKRWLSKSQRRKYKKWGAYSATAGRKWRNVRSFKCSTKASIRKWYFTCSWSFNQKSGKKILDEKNSTHKFWQLTLKIKNWAYSKSKNLGRPENTHIRKPKFRRIAIDLGHQKDSNVELLKIGSFQFLIQHKLFYVVKVFFIISEYFHNSHRTFSLMQENVRW